MTENDEPTWEQFKAQARARHFGLVNAQLRRDWALRYLHYGALVRRYPDPRLLGPRLLERFPDAWALPQRWYFDHLLRRRRAAALDWLLDRPRAQPLTDAVLDYFLGHGPTRSNDYE
jgi:hypothetical protein